MGRVATLEILHDEAKAWGRRAASALSARSDLGKVARLRGGGCGSSVHQEHIKEVSFPAVTPEEREIHQQAATGDPIERRRLGNVYDEAESIWEAMRAGEAILVRASWLLKRAGYEEGEVEVMDFGEPTGEKAPGWVLRRDAAPLPHATGRRSRRITRRRSCRWRSARRGKPRCARWWPGRRAVCLATWQAHLRGGARGARRGAGARGEPLLVPTTLYIMCRSLPSLHVPAHSSDMLEVDTVR